MPELEGSDDGAGLRICVVVARWNEFVTRKLLDGARAGLGERGLPAEDITVAWVPGSFEVPTAARWAAESERFDAVIAIGAVIKGETDHYEHVAGPSREGHRRGQSGNWGAHYFRGPHLRDGRAGARPRRWGAGQQRRGGGGRRDRDGSAARADRLGRSQVDLGRPAVHVRGFDSPPTDVVDIDRSR